VPDDLIISGGGSSAVATDELYTSRQQLASLGTELAAIRRALAAIDAAASPAWLESSGAPTGATRVESDLDRLAATLVQAQFRAETIGWALETAAVGYGFAERLAGSVMEKVTAELGGLVGRMLPGLLLASGGGVALLGLSSLLVLASPLGRGLALGAVAHMPSASSLLTNAATVSLIRTATEGIGGAALGALGVPQPIAGLINQKLGLAARSIMGVGSTAGMLTETPVRLVSSRPIDTAGAPSGYADRLARVPDTDETGGAQVIIERYEMPSGPDRYEVYVAGTADFSPVATDEPWDMTSNLANAAGPDSASVAAVTEALRLAGADSDTPVQFTGYSQGAGTAARLAASEEFNTYGVTTFGGPTGQVPIREGFPAVLVEHADDPIPALGGVQENQHAVIVERDVFGGRDIPQDHPVPAHLRGSYEETARLMDKAESEQLRGSRMKLDGFTDGATLVSSTAYRFERVSETSSR
jgi:hypothetical protein